jgi:hypothetical protein
MVGHKTFEGIRAIIFSVNIEYTLIDSLGRLLIRVTVPLPGGFFSLGFHLLTALSFILHESGLRGPSRHQVGFCLYCELFHVLFKWL